MQRDDRSQMKVVRSLRPGQTPLPRSLVRTRFVFPMLVGLALILDSLTFGSVAGADPAVLTPVAGNDTEGLPTSGQSGSSQGIGYPQDIAVDSQGNVYFVDTDNYEVDVVSASTGLLTVLAGTGAELVPTSPGESGSGQTIGYPTALAVDGHGNIFFTDAKNNQIDELSAPIINAQGAITGGDILTVLADSVQGVDNPADIAVDASGDVFFANSNNETIFEITAASEYADTTQIAGTGSEGAPTTGLTATTTPIGVPSYLAVDSSGNVYFADPNNDEVDEISAPVISGGVVTGGDILNLLAGDGSDTAPTTGQSGQGQSIGVPLSVAVDASGNVYFTDGTNDEVDELSPGTYTDGVLSGGDVLNILAGDGDPYAPTSGDPGYGQAAGEPHSVAVDASGNVYYSDGYNTQVDELSPGVYTNGVLTGGDVVNLLSDDSPWVNQDDSPTNLVVTGGGIVYLSDESPTNTSAFNVDELEAPFTYTPIATASVTYAASGGIGTLPFQGVTVDGSSFTVASGAGITKSGFTFAGWSDGTSTYQPGSTYTVGSSPVVLSAQWTPVTNSVTYAASGGTGTLPTQESLASGGTFSVASGAGITKSGFTFAGWSDGTSTYQPGSTYTVGSSSVTLTAQWKSAMAPPSTHPSDTVYFGVGSSKLTPAAVVSLRAFASRVRSSGVMTLTITGYTDSTGTESSNHSLSIQRARSVAAVLDRDLQALGLTSVSIRLVAGGVSTTHSAASLERRAVIAS